MTSYPRRSVTPSPTSEPHGPRSGIESLGMEVSRLNHLLDVARADRDDVARRLNHFAEMRASLEHEVVDLKSRNRELEMELYRARCDQAVSELFLQTERQEFIRVREHFAEEIERTTQLYVSRNKEFAEIDAKLEDLVRKNAERQERIEVLERQNAYTTRIMSAT